MLKEIYIIIIFILLFLIAGSLFSIFWLNSISETELSRGKKLLCYRIFLVSAGLMVLLDGMNQLKSLWQAIW